MTSVEHKQILNGLVANGLRHLERGLNCFEAGDFHFAVTDAFFGIEIVCKALIFDAKWEYVFDEPGDADVSKLKGGNCRTIGLGQVEKRLRKLLGRPLPQSFSHFHTLAKHRNKVVHFFHPGLEDGSEKAMVARDLANAWTALRELRLLSAYESVFGDHDYELRALDGKLLLLADYLDQMAVTIRSVHLDRDSLEECPACKRSTFDGYCLLCHYHEPSHRDVSNGAEYFPPADCPECGADESVMHFGENGRCTECGGTYACIGVCEYCGGTFASNNNPEDDEGSFQTGCPNCDGQLGRLMARED